MGCLVHVDNIIHHRVEIASTFSNNEKLTAEGNSKNSSAKS